MAVSVFDMFRVGIGPSSSHTVGPMKAGLSFINFLRQTGDFDLVTRVRIELMGSLAATGRGHSTDTACLLGLIGERPETVNVDSVAQVISAIGSEKKLILGGSHTIAFDTSVDILFHPQKVPSFHTNSVEFSAYQGDKLLCTRRYYSIGGGFIVEAKEENPEEALILPETRDETVRPYPFKSAAQLIEQAKSHSMTIAEVMRANEGACLSDEEIDRKLDAIWETMKNCIARGLSQSGPLPGPFKVQRRAKRLAEELRGRRLDCDPLTVLDWVNAYAFAVNEENAAGGRVVTAPTNGAAGVIPAVIKYYLRFVPEATEADVRTFLLTAGAIGILYKENASISGAEVGCQGEVGVACSMAAGGLAAVLGATTDQIENAAEIAMEHNLGLTCDPVAGQVQIPCIERNAVAAVKAINAARMALVGNGMHYVSLDEVIRTMLETGRDMQTKYKETSRGGLAVCVVEC